MKVAARVVAVAAISLTALAGCRSTGGPPATPGGGEVRVAMPRPRDVDPGNAAEPAGQLLVATMCDTLVNIDPESGEVRPGLADSWVISDSGSKVTLRLRRGIRFSNGAAVSADDVVFTLSRLADARYASDVADLVRPIAGFRALHGEEEQEDDGRDRSRLSGVRTISGQAVEIQLSEQRSDFVRALAHPATAIVPRRAATDDVAFARQPVCAGPYRLARPYEPSAPSIRLERVPAYRPPTGAPAGRGAGGADVVELQLVDDAAQRVAAVRVGTADVALTNGERPTGEGVEVATVATPYLEYLGFGATALRSRWHDPAVRAALSVAVDRAAVADVVWGSSRAPATAFLPPAVGRRLAAAAACDLAPVHADVERARSLLAAKGIDLHGERLTLSYNDELGNAKTMAAVAAQWRDALGLDVELAPMSWSDYSTKLASPDGVGDVFRFGWRPSYVAADRYLSPLFGAEGTGSDNVTRYSDPDFQRTLVRGARRAVDEEDSRADYVKLAHKVCDDLPMIPLLTGAEHVVFAPSRARALGSPVDSVAGAAALRSFAGAAGGG